MERLTAYDYVAGVKVGDLKVGVSPEKAYDKLFNYEEAEEQGRLKIAPCTEGTEVWCIVEASTRTYDGIYKGKIYDNLYDYEIMKIKFNSDDQPAGILEYYFTDFGKLVFLTKEESEIVLNN